MSSKTMISSLTALLLVGAAAAAVSCVPLSHTIKPKVENPQMELVVYNSLADQKEVYLTPKQFYANTELQKALQERAFAANDAYFKDNSADPKTEKWETLSKIVGDGTAAVLAEATPEGTIFCTDGLGQVLLDGNGDAYIDGNLRNNKCDPDERIRNYAAGEETFLFDYARLVTFDTLEGMQHFLDNTYYQPLQGGQ